MALKYVRVPVNELLAMFGSKKGRDRIPVYIKWYLESALEYYWAYHMGRKPEPKEFKYLNTEEKKLFEKSMKILDKDCALRKKHKNNLQKKKSMLES